MKAPAPAAVDRAGLIVGFALVEAGVAMWTIPGALVLAGALILASVLWRRP